MDHPGAAGITHQINTLTGAILTSTDFAVLTEYERKGPQVLQKSLNVIPAQAILCGKIVRIVLHFPRA
jgi:hypothetical protein